MPDGLTQDQIALVLRRAADLDRHCGSPYPAGLDEAAVEQAALEAGLSQSAVRRALAELHAGLLDPLPTRRFRGVLGPATMGVSRTLPGPVAHVEEHLHRFLHGQLFELRRDHGSRTTWVRRRGLEATARRVVDRAVQRRLILRDVNHVDLSIVEEDVDWVLVRLDVDVLSARHTQGTIAGSATIVGGGMAVSSAAMATAHPGFLLLSATGAGLLGAGHWAGARVYGRRVGEIESGLGGMLDRLERGDRSRPAGRRHAV